MTTLDPMTPLSDALPGAVSAEPAVRRKGGTYDTLHSNPRFRGEGVAPHECDTCCDVGWLQDRTQLPKPGSYTLPFIPCPTCTGVPKLADVLVKMGMPAKYWDETFDNTNWKWVPFSDPPLDLNNRSRMMAVYHYAQDYARGEESTPPWLVMTGDPGCGKTRIACCILRERWETTKKVGMFVNMVDYLDSLKATLDYGEEGKRQFAQIVGAAQSAPMLALDDVGVTKDTEWAKERLYALLNWRYNEKLPTIVTTNVPLSQLDRRTWDRLDSTMDGTSRRFELGGIKSYRSGNPY